LQDDGALQRFQSILSRVGESARRSGRRPEDITVMAVTKTVPFERIEPVQSAGISHWGENRVQEALGKFQNADGSRRMGGQFHLIGPLQSNKAKKAVAFFDVIQTLDRVSLADDLDRHAAALGKVMRCLVEIKISPEMSKSGLSPDELPGFLDTVSRLKHVSVEGLMGIPPADATGNAARPWFAKLRNLLEKTPLKTLSMGMSSDFEVAIEEGATMVRIGSALFGARG